MHEGSLAILEDAIYYYDRGGNRNPQLLAFLRSLTGGVPQRGPSIR